MFSFLLDKYLGMELLGFMVTEEPLDCCTKWLHRITFPPALYEGSNPVCFAFFYYSHPSGGEVIFLCGFDLHFPGGQ